MKDQFIPYEEALALKELGFDGLCLGKYCKYNLSDPIKLYPHTQDYFKGPMFNSCSNSEYQGIEKVAAPLYQQAFQFFRDHIEPWPIEAWIAPYLSPQPRQYEGFYLRRGETVSIGVFKTHEEAQLACLKQLIILAKKQQIPEAFR